MPAELHDAPPAEPLANLDAPALAALRRIALECAQQADVAGVLQVLRGAGPPLGADAVEVALVSQDAPSSPLAVLCTQALHAQRTLAGSGAQGRAVAVPLRVRGEPAALALGWAAEGPAEERARALADALAEQATVALAAAARLEEVRDAAFRRDRFFSAMSHDLRTPITAIVGYGELLQDGIVGPLTDRQQEMVERICQVSGELAELVTDMLDLAKLDAGRMEFHREAATLAELVESGLEGAEPRLEPASARIRRGEVAEGATRLWVDRPRVRQVLANLVAHAAQAAPGGEVGITAGIGPAAAWIRVEDRGPPLVSGAEESLFDALPRGVGRTGRVGPGAALSLALSRRIARAMGGEVEASARPEGGAALVLRLPRAADV